MKSIFNLLLAATAIFILGSCRSYVKPSTTEMSKENLTIVQVLNASQGAADVFGDTLRTDNYAYYVYAKGTAQLVPVANATSNHNSTLNSYLQSAGVLSPGGCDTINVAVGMPKAAVMLKQYKITDVHVTSVYIN